VEKRLVVPGGPPSTPALTGTDYCARVPGPPHTVCVDAHLYLFVPPGCLLPPGLCRNPLFNGAAARSPPGKVFLIAPSGPHPKFCFNIFLLSLDNQRPLPFSENYLPEWPPSDGPLLFLTTRPTFCVPVWSFLFPIPVAFLSTLYALNQSLFFPSPFLDYSQL